ncbi:sensor histidine kinase [Anaerophaga thermohalophila]|jgi:sensor histidine kinase YesM|uniref:sensor histidine kinase n=1 Tax=Anaerophaga thermohalophila TaxID=177400 RepID=UPI000319CAE2|nr:histidine kinase [Anaerophaga thermohalophila]
MQRQNNTYHPSFTHKPWPQKIAFYKRLMAEILISLLFIVVLVSINKDNSFNRIELKGVCFVTFAFVFLSEGIFTFDSLVAKKYSWHNALFKRVGILLTFTLVWMFVTGYLASVIRPSFIPDERLNDKDNFAMSVAILVLFITLYVSGLIAANYHSSLKYFILENEKLRQEKLRMDYFALQDQLNPHFLFNNLSTLMAIIPEDQGKALRFTENFTDVYRYVLKSSKLMFVTLREEVNFIKAYLALHKERLGNGFSFTIDVKEEKQDRVLPPLSLQYLVENVIKHNIATEDRPLVLSLTTRGARLMVTNNFQPKVSTYSTNTGLNNLRKRYEFFNLENQIEILNSGETFTVSIPLIDKKYVHEI